MVLSLRPKAGTYPLDLINKVIHLLGGRMSFSISEEDGTENCPYLQLLGGGVPYGDWDKFLAAQE